MTTADLAALALIENRSTVPNIHLGEPGPSEAEIRRIVAAAVRVPDHGKLKPWRFVLVRDAARADLDARLGPIYRTRFPDAPAEKTRLEETRFSRVPLTIMVVSTAAEHVKIPVYEQELSVGAACMNLMLAAHGLGYSAHWVTGWLCHDAEALAILGVKPGERVAGFFGIGTPTAAPIVRPRPAFEDVTTDWRP